MRKNKDVFRYAAPYIEADITEISQLLEMKTVVYLQASASEDCIHITATTLGGDQLVALSLDPAEMVKGMLDEFAACQDAALDSFLLLLPSGERFEMTNDTLPLSLVFAEAICEGRQV